MKSSLFYAFFLSLIIGTILTPFFIAAAMKVGMIDNPGYRKIHKEPVARAGGLAFAIGALLSISIWSLHHTIIFGVIIGSIIIVVLGSLDDYLDLRAKLKFLGQTVAAGATATYAQLSWQPLSNLAQYELSQWVVIPIIIFILVMMTNAINFSDGLDGLAGGLSFLSFGMVAYLAYQMDDTIILHLTLPILGGLLGFLRFNTFPARVFMGDGGSQFLGFLLAISVLLLTDSERSPFSPLLILFLVGMPLLDLLIVTTRRLVTGTSPFQADKQHLHHKLLEIGFSHHQVVLVMYSMQFSMIALAYFLRWSSDIVLVGLYLGILLIVGCFFFFVSSVRLPIDLVKTASHSTLYWRSWIQSVPRVSKFCICTLGLAISGFLLLGLILPLNISSDIALASLGIAAVLVLGLILRTQAQLFMARMGLYLGVTIVLYLAQNFVHELSWNIQLAFQGFFVLLIILLLLSIHLDEEKWFQTNPMDYLLLFLALIIPFLPEVIVSGIDLGSLAAKLIILFFSSEVLLQAYSPKSHYWGYLSATILAGIGTHTFW